MSTFKRLPSFITLPVRAAGIAAQIAADGISSTHQLLRDVLHPRSVSASVISENETPAERRDMTAGFVARLVAGW